MTNVQFLLFKSILF